MTDAYLDHAATTPMRAEAIEAVQTVMAGPFGNPSGSHRWAREARRVLDDARDVIADAAGAQPAEVVFTSGGTEADNLAVRGTVEHLGGRALCSAVEHHAVLNPVLASGGSTIAVDRHGRLDLDALAGALTSAAESLPSVSLVSAMVANNELGTVQSIEAVALVARRLAPGALVHTDAVAAAPWLDLAEVTASADLVSLSGHKIGGPKGIGALIVRGDARVAPMLLGGGQEQGRRSGTPDVAAAAGLAVALAVTAAERVSTGRRVESLRNRLLAGLADSIPGLVVMSPTEQADRTPGTIHVCVPGVEREALLFLLDEAGVAASWGSSCSSGATEPSHVLAALGVDPMLAAGALRLTLGWSSTEADVDAALRAVPAAVARLRASMAPATAGSPMVRAV